MSVEGGSLALAMSGDRGLALALHDGELTARPISSEGRALESPHTSRISGAQGLLALVPRGERYLLLARGSCEASAHCLIAQALDRRGAVLAAPTPVPLPEPTRTARRAGDEGPLFFAWSTTGGHRALERFTLESDGSIAHASVALGDEPASAESPVEILALAADGDRYAAIWRRGPTEDVESEVYVTTSESHRDVHALHHALAIDSIELRGDALALITTFEFSRPHLLRLSAREGEPTLARELASGARVPAPFTERERAELDPDGRGLWLRRRDAKGDPIGERALVADGSVESAAITRRGDALVVTWLAGGAVHGRRVRCP